jgi:cation diffusion facilitator family transporter
VDTVRAGRIALISWIAIAGNLLLAALKIAAGLWAGSLAVLGDGIDSTTDIVASGITLLAARVIVQPPDREHPYGHYRAETIASKTVSFIIFFAGAQLALSTLRRLISGQHGGVPEMVALYAVGISIAVKIALTVLLNRSGRKWDSSMLRANGKNMQNDILISAAALVGVISSQVFHLPLLDVVVAFLISIWIMRTAFVIFMESNLELMDGVGDRTVYAVIFKAVEEISGAVNPHRTRVRRLGNMYSIDLDIEVDGRTTVTKAHEIAVQVEQTIKQRVDNVYDIMVHVEPLGNVEPNERFGERDGL